jgi:hypothetical protein
MKSIIAIILILIVGVFAYVSVFGLSFEGSESDSFVPAVTGENVSTYKDSCIELDLINLSKDYRALNGQMVKVPGQIYEKREFIQFDKTRTFIIIKVPGLSPDPYILSSYTGTIPYTINDTITVYGKYMFPVGTDSPPELANKDLAEITAGYIEKV